MKLLLTTITAVLILFTLIMALVLLIKFFEYFLIKKPVNLTYYKGVKQTQLTNEEIIKTRGL